MSFVYSLALGVALLIAAPYLAHRLRRRRAEERSFAAARLVAPAPPKARRRSNLEDRLLFALRALAILALAILGASPLVRCSRLSLQRSGGASVAFAIVLDDSMSMRAKTSGKTRFDKAKDGAKELLASAREGDAVAIVLAGAPSRVALAATTDLAAARSMVDAIPESDRATDLDGALAIARGLIAALPQVDRRVVVLSDLADGHEGAAPLGEGSPLPVWFATPELCGVARDCAILAADESGSRVHVSILCTKVDAADGRDVLVTAREGGAVLARVPLPASLTGDVTLTLPRDAAPDSELVAKLTGADAIASDDAAPVVPEAGPGAVAVVADTARESAATGGAPVVEQALSALKLDVAVRPIPVLPDRTEDLTPFVGIVLDDPPGLTPEQRRALSAFFDAGGVVLVALGPRAAAAPLGATLEPLIDHGVSWTATGVKGADASSAAGPLADSAGDLSEIGAHFRTVLAPEDVAALDPLLAWADGAPLFARRAIGRGEAWIVTLPFAVDESELTLTPAFLALLDAWVAEAHARATPRRSDVGSAWTFAGAKSVTVEGPAGPVPVTRDTNDGRGNARALIRVAPPLIGAYHLAVDGSKNELRVAAPLASELDMRPRSASATGKGSALGDNHASVDISSTVALLLLLILAGEMGVRLWARAREQAAATAM